MSIGNSSDTGRRGTAAPPGARFDAAVRCVVRLASRIAGESHREDRTSMVYFAGGVLAGGSAGPRALALHLAALPTLSSGRTVIRCNIRAAARHSVLACANSWLSR